MNKKLENALESIKQASEEIRSIGLGDTLPDNVAIVNEDEIFFVRVRTDVRYTDYTVPGYRLKTRTQLGGWKLLLGKTTTELCVRDGKGFKLLASHKGYNQSAVKSYQVVKTNKGVLQMITSKSKKDKKVGISILDQLAREKYIERGVKEEKLK